MNLLLNFLKLETAENYISWKSDQKKITQVLVAVYE